ncbi:MAG: RNA polymerase sigma factor [Solirubrobacteraceae bacterium]
MEASALPVPAGLARTKVASAPTLLRLRSDEQLVALFRAGNDEAFRIIHDRYRQRLFAYARQMLSGSRQDAEDALQDVFVRAYFGLRANRRELALRAWLYRVAHNRCIDELRRPIPPYDEVLALVRRPGGDPIAEAEQREALRRLIADVRRLPSQQRSALLMRELSGMTYAELAGALEVSVPAVKSLLVRARLGLAQALEARDTACSEIREELVLAHDRGARPNATARRHLRDCAGCLHFRAELRAVSRNFAGMVPAFGPLGALAGLLGLGGGAGHSAAAGSGVLSGGGAAATGTGAVSGVGVVAGAAGSGGLLTAGGIFASSAGHVAALLAAAVTAGGAIAIQPVLTSANAYHASWPAAGALTSSATSAGDAAVQIASIPRVGAAAVLGAVTLPPGTGGSSSSVSSAGHPAAGQMASISGDQPSGSGPREYSSSTPPAVADAGSLAQLGGVLGAIPGLSAGTAPAVPGAGTSSTTSGSSSSSTASPSGEESGAPTTGPPVGAPAGSSTTSDPVGTANPNPAGSGPPSPPGGAASAAAPQHPFASSAAAPGSTAASSSSPSTGTQSAANSG